MSTSLNNNGKIVDTTKENHTRKLNAQIIYSRMEENEDIRNSFHAKHKPYERRVKE